MMQESILVVIPVTEPMDLLDRLKVIKAWLKPYPTPEVWTYDIPFSGDYRINIIFQPGYKDVAMHFRLACA